MTLIPSLFPAAWHCSALPQEEQINKKAILYRNSRKGCRQHAAEKQFHIVRALTGSQTLHPTNREAEEFLYTHTLITAWAYFWIFLLILLVYVTILP